MKFRTTADGSLTALHPQHGEAYHSVHGALTQARHLYLELTQTQQHPAPGYWNWALAWGSIFGLLCTTASNAGCVWSIWPMNCTR